MDTECFNATMSFLLKTRSADIFRSKGVLAFHGHEEKFVFQGVHENVNFGASKQAWAEGETRVNKLVFIGRGLDRAELEELLGACVHPVKPTTLDDILVRTRNHELDAIAVLDDVMDDEEDEEFERAYEYQRQLAILAWTARRDQKPVMQVVNELFAQGNVPEAFAALQPAAIIAQVSALLQSGL